MFVPTWLNFWNMYETKEHGKKLKRSKHVGESLRAPVGAKTRCGEARTPSKKGWKPTHYYRLR